MYIEIAYRKSEIVEPKTVMKKVIIDLNKCGILSKNDRILAVNFLPMSYAYVIYDRNRQHILKTIQDFLQENNIYSIGRFGAWKYSYMEESILDGKSIAEKIR
ncbi:unnamed protein product [marine sediment metagenome]|uniref:Amine oxidase domain-containing protein n=1 Tax=marine sediment metagenome TaxID=412755 RepID=X1HI59_9ZZZZ